MSEDTTEIIAIDALLERTTALRRKGCRLVQVSATRLAEHFELTYSFEEGDTLLNLRLNIPAERPWVPSISGVFWCAFLYENEMHDLFNIQVDGINVDFKGTLYHTAIPYPLNAPPAAKPRVVMPAKATTVSATSTNPPQNS